MLPGLSVLWSFVSGEVKDFLMERLNWTIQTERRTSGRLNL